MGFFRWQKRNTIFSDYIWIAVAIIAFLVALSFWSLGPAQLGGIAVATYFVLNFIITFTVNNLFPNAMVRVLRFDYIEFEDDIRTLFQENKLNFFRRTGEEIYNFDFPEEDLTVSVEPYVVVPSRTTNSNAATKLTLEKLSSANRSFADQVTGLIDELVTRRLEKAD